MSTQPFVILNKYEFEALQHALKEYGSYLCYTHAVSYKDRICCTMWMVYLDYRDKESYYPSTENSAKVVGKLIGRIAQRYPKRYPHYKIF